MPEQQVEVSISNAQLRELDKTYIELIPAPGEGNYIDVINFWLTTAGDNQPNIENVPVDGISPYDIDTWAYFALLYINNSIVSNPLYAEESTSIHYYRLSELLATDPGVYGERVGGQSYRYNSALMAGVAFIASFSNRVYGEANAYSEDAYDTYIAPVMDKSFGIRLLYRILSSDTADIPDSIVPVNSLVIEDGTGLENSNSYVDIAYSNQYFLSRGMSDVWTGTEDEKIGKLLVSAGWLNGAFNWRGKLLRITQAMAWPRMGEDVEGRALSGVPEPVKFAQCELALHYQRGELERTFNYHGIVEEFKVGPISQKFRTIDDTVNFSAGASGSVEFTYVRNLLANYILPDDSLLGPDAPPKFVEVTLG